MLNRLEENRMQLSDLSAASVLGKAVSVNVREGEGGDEEEGEEEGDISVIEEWQFFFVFEEVFTLLFN